MAFASPGTASRINILLSCHDTSAVLSNFFVFRRLFSPRLLGGFVEKQIARFRPCVVLTSEERKGQTLQGRPMPFVELIIVLFLILAVITPFLALYLLRKYKRLREDLDVARQQQSRESAHFRSEI